MGGGNRLTINEMTVCDPRRAQHIAKLKAKSTEKLSVALYRRSFVACYPKYCRAYPLYRANGPSWATKFAKQSKAVLNSLDLSCINLTLTVSKGALVREQTKPATIEAEKCSGKPSCMIRLLLSMFFT